MKTPDPTIAPVVRLKPAEVFTRILLDNVENCAPFIFADKLQTTVIVQYKAMTEWLKANPTDKDDELTLTVLKVVLEKFYPDKVALRRSEYLIFDLNDYEKMDEATGP